MRKALNENPMVQLAVIGVAGVVFAIILFTTVLSSDEEPATSPAATPAADATGGGAAAGAETPAPAPAPATPETPAPAPEAGGESTVPADDLIPGEGLPEGVLVALAKRQAVALIVYDPEGISDQRLRSFVDRLEGRGDVAVFDVKAKDIARYARITGGLEVTQAPALVVVQPRDGSGDQLVASVSYGFRSPKSVDTAVEGALYDGEQRGFAPE